MRNRKPEPEKPARPPGVGEECDAFLAGDWAEHLAAHGAPVPAWAWLNRVAHGGVDELRALTRAPGWGHAPLDEWDRLRACVADTLFQRARQASMDVTGLQLSVLVPLELMLLGDERLRALTNAELLVRVLGLLRHPSSQAR
jgi:hypothetical protein